MKALNIIDHMGPGGAQIVMKYFFNDNITNNNIYLYALRKKKKSVDIIHKNYWENSNSGKFSLAALNELKKIIVNNNITIIHCHLFRAQVFGLILKLFYFKNITLIFHEHGLIFRYGFQSFHMKKIYHMLLRIFKRRIDYFITVSKATKNIVTKKFGFSPNKVTLLYNFLCLDIKEKTTLTSRQKTELFANMFNISFPISTDDFIVGFAARLIKSKGWKVFIHAIHQAIETDSTIKAFIAGSGPDYKKVMRYIKKHKLTQNIIAPGFIKDMPAFYSVLDTYVASSYREAMGLTVIEAQSQGIPVIIADVPALNELVENNNNGLIFSIKKQDLKNKILLLKNNKNLRDILINNSYHSVQQYFKKNYYSELIKIYQNF